MATKKKLYEEEELVQEEPVERRWDENIDYGTILKEQMESGADKNRVADTLGLRVEKAANTPGLEKFAYDDVYKQAMDYITKQDYTSPEWASKYGSKIDELTNDILNRGSFTYDVNEDPTYAMYADMYERGGRRAMEDTLGQMAMRTGGLASSYAQSAAQQEYNYYMSQLADKVPELRQLAYEMYMNDGDTMRQNLGMLTDLDNIDFGRYESQYDRYSDARDEAKKRLETYLAMGGNIADYDPELLKQTGYTTAEINAIKGYYTPETRYSYTPTKTPQPDDDGAEEIAEPLSAKAQNVYMEITRYNRSWESRIDAVEDAYNRGSITKGEAQTMLDTITKEQKTNK